eukprot:COSAG01_NODE_27207_length_691_cov_1.822635_2_plen_68_part_00
MYDSILFDAAVNGNYLLLGCELLYGRRDRVSFQPAHGYRGIVDGDVYALEHECCITDMTEMTDRRML